MAYTDDRRKSEGLRRVAIREVNMEAGYVTAQDAFEAHFQISVDFHQPLVAIPVPGEMWLISQRGYDYYLERKLESSEEAGLEALQPGDRRISTSGAIYLDGSEVKINGQTIDEIVVPQFEAVNAELDALAIQTGLDIDAVEALVAALSSISVLTGEIRAYGGSAAPAGWLLCDGSLVSRTTYASLYGIIGFNYSPTPGADPGSNNFYLPDTRGRLLTGVGTHADVNALGKNDGTALASRRMAHSHGLGNLVFTGDAAVITGGAHGHTFTGTPAVISGGAHGHTFTGSAVTSGLQSANHQHTVSVSGGTSADNAHTHGYLVPTFSAYSPSGGFGSVWTGNYQTLQTDQLGNHSHSVSASGTTASENTNHSHQVTAAGTISSGDTHTHNHTPAGTLSSGDTHTHNYTPAGTMGGTIGTITSSPSESPSYLTVNYIIKT